MGPLICTQHDSGLDQTAIDTLPVFLYGDVTISLQEPLVLRVLVEKRVYLSIMSFFFGQIIISLRKKLGYKAET